MKTNDMFEDSILIVAHPDDDILWLSSVFDKVEQIVFCFNDSPRRRDRGPARKKAIADYPIPNVSTLDIMEAHSFNKANWKNPVLTGYGIELSTSPEVDAVFQKIYTQVFDALKGLVKGKKNIFTHNPWGDYGHEDHILVYRALKSLQAENDYTIWYSNYCSNRSLVLMNQYISGYDSGYCCLPSNISLAKEIAEIYRKHGCWTWFDDYQWFEEECLMSEVSSSTTVDALSYGHIFPLNYLKLDTGKAMSESVESPVKNIARRIRRAARKIF